jgi:solute carrier family 35 (UDP-sugar transporter), member A1/2/3
MLLIYLLARLATLAIQNSMLTIIMHYSRVSVLPSQMYSAATAVLVNELLKGFISFAIAFARVEAPIARNPDIPGPLASPTSKSWKNSPFYPQTFVFRIGRVTNEVFSQDCWKLSIPAVLYGM